MLNQNQLSNFDTDGFLVIEDVLSPEDRMELYDEYAQLVNTVAHNRDCHTPDWGRMTFEQRFTHLVAHDPQAYEYLDISLPLKAGLDETAGVHNGPAVFKLLTHRRILDIVESIIGPEIYSNPVQHVRIKPPASMLHESARGNSNMSRTGWHQDAAVIVQEADNSPILTVWVALTDATEEMGCMRAVAGSHHWSALGKHCPGRSGVGEIFIPPEIVNEHKPVNLEVKAGGVVLLNKQTWHGAGPNRSSKVRWSFDLRYQPPGFNTGRECFPGFMARSASRPESVLSDADAWSALWKQARTDIATGLSDAIFNERWNRYRDDPMCA